MWRVPAQVDHPDFLFTTKPCGISSHRPSHQHIGFVEWLNHRDSDSYKVCHRLDKETSGAIVFAKTKKAAAGLTQMFTQHQVEKEYYFISDKKSRWAHWWAGEEKAKGTRVEECPWQEGAIGCFESFTEFLLVECKNSLYLYLARPRTGKTHQIRKHAVQSQIPILGDSLYGGQPFPRLMLHSKSLKFKWHGEALHFESPPSLLFQNLDWISDPDLCRWMISIERRRLLFPEKWTTEDESIRLFHSETCDLRGDKVGKTWVLGWWKKEEPTFQQISKIKTFMKSLKQERWVFQWRPGVGDKKSAQIIEGSPPDENWVFKEESLSYRASLERGQNFGLFLDQRDRRLWVKKNSSEKSVLNLFAFTCGFSLNAALGGASQVVSVDLYKKYLQWGRENFELNSLDPSRSQYEWRAMDSREYLKFAGRKQLQFDMVICDPPSFSRDKKNGVFRVERDHPELLQACWDLLKPKGTLLFSTNFEKWDLDTWKTHLEALLGTWKGARLEVSPSQWDFEWQSQSANLKAFFIKKG